jgi:class 3 adenylate cyclase
MPIFMDRHDAEGVTQEQAAQMHLQDVAVQERYGVRFLTYWFEAERGRAFCLIEAPDAATAERAHAGSHGQMASEIIEVDLSAVEAFLGRIQDPQPVAPAAPAAVEGGFRTVMFTDLAGSTEMTARLGDRLAAEAVRAHDALVRRALGQHGGREVKHTGDGIMASFERVTAAVDCAAAIQRAFANYNESSREPLRVRVGLDAGEPVEDSNDLFGRTVQLAARLCDAAAAGQILASEAVRHSVGEDSGFVAQSPKQLKGFAQPVACSAVVWQ